KSQSDLGQIVPWTGAGGGVASPGQIAGGDWSAGSHRCSQRRPNRTNCSSGGYSADSGLSLPANGPDRSGGPDGADREFEERPVSLSAGNGAGGGKGQGRGG